MKIALISPYDLDRPGGVQNHVRELAATLTNRGHTVRVFGPGRIGGLGVSVTVRVNGSRAPIGLSPWGVRQLYQQLARFNPDVVHIHEPGVPVIGWAAARWRGNAVRVATCHAYAAPRPIHGALRPIGARIVARIDRFIAVSSAAQQFHSRALGVSPTRFTVIGNGIDVGAFTANEPRLHTDVAIAPRVLYVGRFDERKGVDVLLRAFATIQARHPQAQLVLVGDGPQRRKLDQLMAGMPKTQVTFAGRVSDGERAHWFTWADIAVAPARGGESFGIVLLEALASGCALVASDIDGYRDVARDGRDAWLVAPDDHRQLAATLQQVINDGDARDTRIRHGLARADAFSWPNITAAIEAVYVDALATRP